MPVPDELEVSLVSPGFRVVTVEALALNARRQKRGLWKACPRTVYDPYQGSRRDPDSSREALGLIEPAIGRLPAR